jgi:hypothetical protein
MKAGFVGFVVLTALTTVALGLIPGDGVMVTSVVDDTLYSVENLLGYADTVLDFTPFLGTFKDFVSLVLGVNPITGEAVTGSDTVIIVGWMFLPSVVRGAGKVILRYTSGLLT